MNASLLQIALLLTLFYCGTLTFFGSIDFDHLALALPLIWLSVIDLRSKTIPDAASLAVVAIGVVLFRYPLDYDFFIDLLAAILILVVLWAVGEWYWRRHSSDALGIGDVKLIAAGTLCVGASRIWQVILIASIGGIIAVLVEKKRAAKTDTGVPFGPFIAYALFLVIAIGV
jgi:prepilin signal peptidase PulO-like enzyme (type II secretory pathway)